MDESWLRFLRGANGAEHAAQVYADADGLAATVAAYLAVGFATGEPAIVIARAEHQALFADHLVGCGWDAERVEADGLLVRADADALLERLLVGTAPDAARFDDVVGGLVATLADRHPGRTIRAFGELVDVLCERGRIAAAIALEELWNELADRYRFSLLCGYHGRLLDGPTGEGALAEVCRVHAQVLLPTA
jgi:hypothetical protein